jgi:hypothetical protein
VRNSRLLPLLLVLGACGGRQAGRATDGSGGDDRADGGDLGASPDGGADLAVPDAATEPRDAADGTAGDAVEGGTGDRSATDGGGQSAPKLRWTLIVDGWDATFVSGAANGEVWITSRESAVKVRPDGTMGGSWSLDLPPGAYVTGLWVAGPDNVYVATYANVILHWDGSGTWKRATFEAGTLFYGIWGSGPADIYAAGSRVFHSTGDDQWTEQVVRDRPMSFFGPLSGTGASDVWLSGISGEVYRSTGDGTWRLERRTGIYYVNALWAASASEAFFVTNIAVGHRRPNDGMWLSETVPPGDATELITSVWGSAPGDVYVGTDFGRLLHSSGDGAWQDAMFDAGQAGPTRIRWIWGRSAGDVYVAAGRGLYHGVPGGLDNG